MRRKIAEQLGLVTTTSDHVRARELAMMSRVLDELPRALELVYDDLLNKKGEPGTGREAMTAEQVLRAMVLKQRFALSYEGLAFALSDSNSVRAFCRLPLSMSTPARSTLQSNIKRVKASTCEQINRLLISYAQDKKIESGRTTRSDCTVVECQFAPPCRHPICRVMPPEGRVERPV
jgi:IS5 family transposase